MPQASLFHYQGKCLRSDLKCTACDLANNQKLQTNCMSGTGPSGATFMFCGFAPASLDDSIGRPLTGHNGEQLQGLLAAAGFSSQRDCFFTNCVKCSPFDTKLKLKHWKACKSHFLKELQEIKPKVIVALGAQAFGWLTGFTGVAKFYRKSFPCVLDESYPVIPIRQPAQLNHCKEHSERQALENSMIQDLQWLKQHVSAIVAKNNPSLLDLDYKTIHTHEQALELFAELEKHPVLGMDFETTSLFPQPEDNILAVGFSWGPKIGRALPLFARGGLTTRFWEDGYVEREIIPRLQKLFAEKEVFGHNLIQFDQKWSRSKLGVHKLNIKFDTQIAHYLLDEERGTHRLEQVAVVYAGMKKWKKDFTAEDTLQLCEYLCKDVDAVSRLRPVFEGLMTKGEKWLMDNLLVPLAHELFETEYAGVHLSEPAIKKLEDLLTEKIDASEKELLGHPAVQKFSFLHREPFDSESPDHARVIMQEYLGLAQFKKTDGGKYSTDKEALEYHADNDFVAMLRENRRLRKLRGTYCYQLKNAMRDGIVHTTYAVHGTVTGRPSSSEPALMNIPKEDTVARVLEDGTMIKKMFLPDPGQIMLQADLNQAELRVLGSISGDKQLCGIFLRGEDAHTSTAAIVYEIPMDQVTKAQRGCVKPINFGIPYGMSEEGLIKKFVAEGGTEDDAKNFLATHKRKFSDVWKYMADQETLVRRTKKQTTFFGRSRRYAIIDNRTLRQAYNFPIQCYASELTLFSLVRIAKAAREMKLRCRTILTVYDSIAWSVAPEHFWQLAQLAHHVMTTIHFPWMKVPMAIDLEAGWNWGELAKVDIKNRKIA